MKQIISDSERKVMEKVWGFGKMITVTDLVVLLNEDGESWTHQTVGTFLKRLEAKGMVSSLKKGRDCIIFQYWTKNNFMQEKQINFYNQN